jgi:hypothetical protein
MAIRARGSIRVAALVTICVAAAGAGLYYMLHARAAVADSAPKGYTAAELKKTADDPEQLRKKMNELRDREDLSEEQRRAAFDNMRELFEKTMDDHASEYASAKTEAEKQAVLDKHLAEIQEHAKEWEKDREEWRKRREKERAAGGEKGTGPEAGGPGGKPGDPPPPGQGGPDGRRGGRMGNMSTQERKARSESRDPDKMARRMAYFNAVRKRADEKGVKLPFGGMGGGRGPGGQGGGGGGRPPGGP